MKAGHFFRVLASAVSTRGLPVDGTWSRGQPLGDGCGQSCHMQIQDHAAATRRVLRQVSLPIVRVVGAATWI